MASTGGIADGGPSEAFDVAMAEAKHGVGDGYRWLYDAYNRRVGALAVSEGSHDPDATVNAVFTKAFRSLDRFVGGQANFADYLYQLARFQITDDRRARNRMAEPDYEHGETLAASDGVTVRLNTTSETVTKAGEALRSLTAEQREVLVLRVFFGLTGPETAEALDKPVGAIRSLQNRAEARLRASAEAGSVML